MRQTLFIVWIIVLIAGIVLFLGFPSVFEPILCTEYETIGLMTREIDDASGKSWATDLYCVDLEGQARAVGEQIGVPFTLIMVILPFVILRGFKPSQDEPETIEA